MYWDVNNLNAWLVEWRTDKFSYNEEFIRDCDDDSKKGYILEVDAQYPKELCELYSDLPFLPERKKIDKCGKLVCNLYDKKNYVIHLKALQQALDHELIIEKVHSVIRFNQETWLESYIDIGTELRTKVKN